MLCQGFHYLQTLEYKSVWLLIFLFSFQVLIHKLNSLSSYKLFMGLIRALSYIGPDWKENVIMCQITAAWTGAGGLWLPAAGVLVELLGELARLSMKAVAGMKVLEAWKAWQEMSFCWLYILTSVHQKLGQPASGFLSSWRSVLLAVTECNMILLVFVDCSELEEEMVLVAQIPFFFVHLFSFNWSSWNTEPCEFMRGNVEVTVIRLSFLFHS